MNFISFEKGKNVEYFLKVCHIKLEVYVVFLNSLSHTIMNVKKCY